MRVIFVAVAAFWLGIAVIAGASVILSRNTPPVAPKEEFATSTIELFLPQNGQIVKESLAGVSGKTSYGASRVLVGTSKGDFIVVPAGADGTFFASVVLDEGPNSVFAFVFPPNEPIGATSKTFFSFVKDPLSKPLYRSFIGRVTAVGDSITLLPTVAGASPVRLIPRHNVRLLRYNDEEGKLIPGALEDLAPGDTVLVDGRAVEGSATIFELRTIIVVPGD